jgi:hypothetical protein
MSGAMIHAFQIAASLSLSLQSPSLRAAPAAPLLRAPPIAMGARKSRYADDGTREKGSDLQSGVDGALKGGLFSGFKWGTEVEVGDPKLKTPAKKGGKVFGDGAGSDKGLGGNQSYRNTESKRLRGSVDEGQQIRQRKLEEYINSDLEGSDKTFGKIIAGSLILTLIALLCGVVAYYGIDGMIFAGSGGKSTGLDITFTM